MSAYGDLLDNLQELHGMRPPDLPLNFTAPIVDLMTIRGHVRKATDWKVEKLDLARKAVNSGN